MLASLVLASLAASVVSARGLPSKAAAPKCPLTWDGLVPKNATGATFDVGGILPYNNAYILGINQTFTQVLKFPNVANTRFDNAQTKPVEVTINNGSVFLAGTTPQYGFRRTELLDQPASDVSVTTGKQTIHFSIQPDETRRLNGSHEYYVFWNERTDYAANPVVVSYGQFFGSSNTSARNTLHVRGNDNLGAAQKTFFETELQCGQWHNFALTLDFNKNTTQVYFSRGQDPLASKGTFANDLALAGQYHFGLLKKPTGPPTLSDISHEGYQPAPINEGLIYGGMFIEKSDNGCVTL